MSALDNIIKRAKQGSSGSTPSRLLSSNKSKKIEDDDDYKTIVDKPSSTYALTPYKSTKSIPSTYTKDFERIYQVVKSSYNCGQMQYNYGTCYYDSLVQNYVQRGEAIVSSMIGYSNVSLQDLPLACNIPSVVYQNCSPPTNMLTTEFETQAISNNKGFRLNTDGLYLFPSGIKSSIFKYKDYIFLTYLRSSDPKFNKYDAEFIVEQKSINELDKLITNQLPYYERYIDYKNINTNVKYFYYLKHIKTGTYLLPLLTQMYIKVKIILLNIPQSVFIIKIYDENLDEIFSINNSLNILKNRTGFSSVSISITKTNNIISLIYPEKLHVGNIIVESNNIISQFSGSFGLDGENSIISFNDVMNLIDFIDDSVYSGGARKEETAYLAGINYFYSKLQFSISEYQILNNISFRNLYNVIYNLTRNQFDTLVLRSDTHSRFLIEKSYYPVQFYPTYIRNLINKNYKIISGDDYRYLIYYGVNDRLIYYSINYGDTFTMYYIPLPINIALLSKDANTIIITSTSNFNLYIWTTNSLQLVRTFDAKISNVVLSFDANIIYVILENRKFFVCFNKKTWKSLNDTSVLPLFFDINSKGNMVVLTSDTELIYFSQDYGITFNTIRKPYVMRSINSLMCSDENFYFTQLRELYCFNFITRELELIYKAPIFDLFIKNIYGNYIIVSNFDYNYIINTKSNIINNLLLGKLVSVNKTLTSLIINDNDIYKMYNTNIPQSLQNTPYTLNNGLCYPSYSFNTSTISNQGVKNVFNGNTFALSSDTTIIKKISNNLSITSSSILKNNTPIYTISGSIRDIACSQNGTFILAAVYNGKLLVSSNSGTSFTEYNEAGNLTGNTSSKSISNINRYWISVDCSFSGKYMSACAYNGNIFISTNNGVLFTSSPENFAKKWVQIVMSKSSDDTKDGIIQFACAEYGLFISYDRGANWSQIRNEVIDSALSNTGSKWSSVAISDSGQYMLATVYGGYVYASYNYGYDWSIYGVSKKECYEPMVYPNNQVSADYLDYNVSASTTLSGTNIINAFKDDTSIWSPTNTDTNRNVTIKLPYKFLLTDINIVNLTSEDVKISVLGSNDGTNWIYPPIGTNLNLYSTVDNNGFSYRWFRLTFSSSNIEIQRIKLLGKTDFVSAGEISQIGNWSSCAIVNEREHYVASFDTGLFKCVVSSSFGKVIKVFSSVQNANISVYDKKNNIISGTINYSSNIYTINFNSSYDFGRIETNIISNGSVTIEDNTVEVFKRDNVNLSRVFFWF